VTHLAAWCCGALLALAAGFAQAQLRQDRKSTRLNSSH